ncbi:MAG: ABC transporter ATP-binding protein [Jaaginema sp. PMC 1079.18]|nr:ABC transporter ATP-binding protein [Jaaginema sp. PMC 1080.18]MEC4849526.1 ABC transporter ATP-binding protein [Jaaginema sp. PMC 1079.18]MEC4865718.1 ABC transporter ATP-binding protein [Jaaginema sp. PMC 1078.18]
MAKVVLEKVYKSFPSRKGENRLNSSKTTNPKANAVNVLRCIDLAVEDGEFMVLVGPSGCGKSTLLRILAGLEELTAGNIYVGDRLVNSLAPKERDIAMVFQNYALYPHLTVYENIAFGLRRTNPSPPPENSDWQGRLLTWGQQMLSRTTRSLPPQLQYLSTTDQIIRDRVHNVAQLLQIENLLLRLPKQLSGGQKQRVALGRAIARSPQVFLMDEPLSNLDAKLRAETRSQIVKLQRQLKTTTIYVTHDQTEAMTMGDRIAVMNQGEIQQLARPLELYNQPANRFVAEFIGSPPMNFLPVNVKAPLLISHDQFRFTLPETWLEALRPYDGRSLLLGIRPEHLSLSPAAVKNIEVTVDLVEALGNDTYITVHLTQNAQTVLQVRLPPDNLVEKGQTVWLSMTLEKIHLFDAKTGNAIWFNSLLE